MSESREILPLSNISKSKESIKMTPEELFYQGKKLYIIGEYSKCLEFLSQACKLKEMESGCFSDEIFEMYLYLAKGYYMYSKYESELFGDALEKNDEEIEGTSEDRSNIEVKNPLESDETIKDNINVTSEDIDNDENDINISQENIDGKDIIKIDHVLEKEKSCDDQPESTLKITSKSEREVLTYLQLSYENVEAAKLILKRQLNEKKIDESILDFKLADCCDLVGNIYLEEDVVHEAINEFKKALELRLKYTSKCDRAVAESYYNLGMAYSINFQLSEAAENFTLCKSIMMECKMEEIRQGGNGKEFSDIILDIEEKIVDCQEGEGDYRHAKDTIQQFLVNTITMSDCLVNDVNHLVKRKVNSTKLKDPTEPAEKCPKINDDSSG